MRLVKFLLIASIFFLLGTVAVYAGINRAPFRPIPSMDHSTHGQLFPVNAAVLYAAATEVKAMATGEEAYEI